MELYDTIDGMISDDRKERFVAEYQQLRIRIEKLERKINSYAKKEESFSLECPIELLCRQKIFMLRYMKILEARAKIEGIELETE